MAISSKCGECGTDLPADAPQGLCPKCLLRHGMNISFMSRETLPSIVANPVIRYFGDYEIDREIARGGMGAVFKAWQLKLNRPVAVKMILEGRLANEEAVKRFYTEAEAAANLQHPNIVAIHEIGNHKGQHYFSMDYVEGPNLSELANGKPLPPSKAAQYVSTLAQAIHYAHQRGTLHRDLKPSNVLIDQHGNLRITDFGLAKLVNNDRNITVSGAVIGTPSYMAPEQAMGRQDLIGPQTDVYSLGAILYELLTSRPPFLGHPMATVRAVIDSEPVAPRRVNHDVPVDLEVICLKCLEKSPQRRYSSARELAEELDRYLKGEPIHARPANAVRKTANWLKRHPGQLAAMTALIILGLGVFVFYLTEQNAYLRTQLITPGLVPRTGAHAAAVKLWKAVGSAGAVFGFLAWFWFTLRSRGLKRSDRWTAAFGEDFQYRPMQPVGSRLRWVLTIVGFINLACAGFLIGSIIRAYVWEGVPPHLGDGMRAYIVSWLGLFLPWLAWQDYRRFVVGGFSRELPADSAAEIRSAVMKFDLPGAMRIYRRAAPDAGAIEAYEHAKRLMQELGVKPPTLSLKAVNWRRLLGSAAVAAVVVASLWLLFPPARPLPSLAHFAAGAFMGLTWAALPRIRGFHWRLLFLMPPFLMLYIVTQMSGMVLISPVGPPYFLGMVCGLALMVAGLTSAPRKVT